LERFFRFGNDDAPTVTARFARVNGNDAAARSVEIAAEPENRAVVADKGIGSVEAVDQFDDATAGTLRAGPGTEFFVEDQVFRVGSSPDVDNQIAAIFGYFSAKAPLLLIFPLVNQLVFCLRSAQPVEVEFMKVIRILEFGLLIRLVIAAIKKSFAI